MISPPQALAAVDDRLRAASGATPTPAALAAVAPLLLDANHATEQPRFHRIGPDETLVSLADAARLLPRIAGKKVNVSTIFRWARIGLRGQFLAYTRVGRRIATSQQALWRFFAAVAAQDRQLGPSRLVGPRFTIRQPITSRRRQRALAEADAILKRAKI